MSETISMRLSDLKKGDKAIIQEVEESPITEKLLEMGCLPGEEIEVAQKAPFGGPIAISVVGYTFSLRRNDAMHVLIDSSSLHNN